MKQYNITEIVKELIGSVQPYGGEHIDVYRLENLKQLINLTEDLVCEIATCLESSNSNYSSIRKIGESSVLALEDLKGLINRKLEELE